MTIRLDGQVAIVTGAGQGLGRSHALLLARRGARIVVNDMGATPDGSGDSAATAKAVVEEIRAAGGEAIANCADVTNEAQVGEMVEQAQSRWGRVDILVNNAGILRDKSFLKSSMEDFRAVLEVHVMGAATCTHAVWPLMRAQAYGRVLFTTSSSGLCGNFGQANYAAAKTAMLGLMNTLSLEGAKYDIRINCLSPTAASRMTRDVMPAEALRWLAPEYVSAGMLFLVGPDAPRRRILAGGAGGFAVVRVMQSPGINLPRDGCTPEAVAAAWPDIEDPSKACEFTEGYQQSQAFLRRAAEMAKAGTKSAS